MKVDKLQRLFQALDSSAAQAKNAKIAEFPKQIPSGSGEAVQLAKNFGVPEEKSESSGKDLQAIKERYLRDGFQPGREEMGQVIFRDLL